jgi:type IV secretion system protein VirD4
MLLLPQEVKEIGKHNELIIYEDIRPIQAEKIIYYQDKVFKKRLLPPPKIKRLQPISNEITAAHQQETQDEPHYRRITIKEIENIDSLSLNDFSIKTTDIIKPSAQPLTNEEIKATAQRYLNLFVES